MKTGVSLALSTLGGLCMLVGACSFDVPKNHDGSSLKINVDTSGQSSRNELLESVTSLWTGGGFRLEGSSPQTLSDFSCFAVNVTGVGVQSNGASQLQGCTSPTNMQGVGIGNITNTVSTGSTVAVSVPSNVPLTIDAYGVFPSNNCGNGGGNNSGSNGNNGSGSGYFLGRVVQTLSQDTNVTIGASYSGAGADVICSGGGGGGGGFQLQGIYPNNACSSGGTPFTISGNGFLPTATVMVDGSPCTNVNVVNSSTITCTGPAGPTGTSLPVTVNNQNGQSGTVSFLSYQSGATFTVNQGLNGQALTLGPVSVGTPTTLALTLLNSGCSPLTIVATTPLSAPFSLTSITGAGCAYSNTFAVGSSCTFNIQFQPTVTGPVTANNISFVTSGGSVNFTGTGQ